MFNLSQPFAHVNAYFILDGEKYDIEQFKIGFKQSTDFKGQPEHEVRGGQLTITIDQTADDNLYIWAKKSTMQKNGQVLFQSDMGITVLRIDFINGYCVHLSREIGALSGTKTSLLISVESISLNGITHDNHWKKQ
ncbi:MAG: hypothetical protein RL662_44 [Bacteroidota bacterium]|jgi:hypothetical protein